MIIRLSIAFAIQLDARDYAIGTILLAELVIAVTLDLADGMVARRLGSASFSLRRADSITFEPHQP